MLLSYLVSVYFTLLQPPHFFTGFIFYPDFASVLKRRERERETACCFVGGEESLFLLLKFY